MSNHIAVVIDWFGPYKGIQEANKVAQNDFEGGLYLFIGRKKHQKSRPKLLYVGKSNDLSFRVNPNHHILPFISGYPLIWLGEIASYGIPGKVKVDLIHQAEWAMIYFLQPLLNEKKAANPPNYPITVFNRWWKKDYETPRKQRPHLAWPDVIDFRGCYSGARIGWVDYSYKYEPTDF